MIDVVLRGIERAREGRASMLGPVLCYDRCCAGDHGLPKLKAMFAHCRWRRAVLVDLTCVLILSTAA